MEHYSSEALILRIKDLGESDLLVLFFTPENGLCKGIAKGGRKSRTRFVNCLDLFCLSQMDYHRKKENQLFLLDSCRLLQAYEALRTDFRRLTLASYFAELTETLFPLHVKAEKMFQLLVQSFELLCQGEAPERVRIAFEAHAMAIGGYAIDLGRCCTCGRTYKGEGRAVFVAEKGGISCLACRKESKKYPGMSPKSVRTLKEIQGPPYDNLPSGLFKKEVLEELKMIFRQHILYWVGKRLKTPKYLE